MTLSRIRTPLAVGFFGLVLAAPLAALGDEIPITTKSDEARELFLKGRHLGENLRPNDARAFYLQAVEKDPNFALALLALANTAPTNAGSLAALDKAVAASESASPGERHLILAQHENVRGSQAKRLEHLRALVKAYPAAPRAHATIGGYHYGRQEYDKAVQSYERAVELDPRLAPVHNMLGYAARALGETEKAEKAFQRYIQLVPDEPNPYDSYAEFLMDQGRFDESIAHYRKALEKDPNFTASYIGIGANQIYLNKGDEARTTFADMRRVARTEDEKRQAAQWTAASFVHEGKTREALNSVEGMLELAADKTDQAGVHGLMARILLESGKADKALQHFDKALALIQEAEVPESRKAFARRNHHYNLARVALAKKDVAEASKQAGLYGEQQTGIPVETRRHHELLGTIAMHQGDAGTAVKHLEQANQQSPRVLFLLAQACEMKGDKEAARAACERAANHNGLAFSYAYVRKAAQDMLKGVEPMEAGHRK